MSEATICAANNENFNPFKELMTIDQAYFKDYVKREINRPRNSPRDRVQSCFSIARGIYSVSTEGHGGIMIRAELAPHILSPKAIAEGYLCNGYYCYEEDCDASIVERELYDKGILYKGHKYFTHSYIHSDRPDAEYGYIPYSKLSEVQQEEFYKKWNKSTNESLAYWHQEYWQAYKNAESSLVGDKCKNELEM